MHPTAIIAVIAFTTGIFANPVPANVDSPISDAEWQALRDGGLKARNAQSSVNQPISDAEWQALQDGGISKREDAASIFQRDKVMNCGYRVTGKGGSNGHGKWIPVQQFSDVADTFCKKTQLPLTVSLEIWNNRRLAARKRGLTLRIRNRQGLHRNGHRKGARDVRYLSNHADQPRQCLHPRGAR